MGFGGYNRLADRAASPTTGAPVLEAYREFSKSGVTLQCCKLPICYNTQDPLRFYLFIDSRSPQKQGEQPKLRLATPYLDIIYQEQERLKADVLEQDSNTEEEDVESVKEQEKAQHIYAAEPTDAAENIENNECPEIDEEYIEEIGDDEDDDDYVEEVESDDDYEVELRAHRKRKISTSRAGRSQKQANSAPTFEMREDGTIVVRHGGEENLLPYQPKMVRDMGLGPRSPWEQARRDRMNAACRMSRARAKEGATRRYTFRKTDTEKTLNEGGSQDIGK